MAVRDHTVIFISAVALAGCATQSSDIAPTYVSPLQYQSYDCGQLTAEAHEFRLELHKLVVGLIKQPQMIKLTGAGIILFWPALFFLGGTKQQEADFARLKGEYEAIQQAAVLKKCEGLVPKMPSPTSPATASSAPT